MGLQFGYQCWCGSKGDEEQHTKYGPGTCDYPCLGDEDEFCGESAAAAEELLIFGDVSELDDTLVVKLYVRIIR